MFMFGVGVWWTAAAFDHTLFPNQAETALLADWLLSGCLGVIAVVVDA